MKRLAALARGGRATDLGEEDAGAASGGLRSKRVSSAVLAGQAEPLGDVQQQRADGGRRERHHLHRRRLSPGVHGTSQETRRAVVMSVARCVR